MTKERFELIAKILMHEAERVQVVALESEVDRFWEDYEIVKKLIDDESYYQDVVVYSFPEFDLTEPTLPIFFTSDKSHQFFRDRFEDALKKTNSVADMYQKKYLDEKNLAKKLSDILEVTA